MDLGAGTHQFYKMHGTGNDFIIIKENSIINQQKITNEEAKRIAKQLCHRKFGIGADGLLILREIQNKFKMHIINSDGSQANMCGNGLRCFAAFLFHQGLICKSSSILTDDGQKNVQVEQTSLMDKFGRVSKYLITLKIGTGGHIELLHKESEKFQIMYFTTLGVPHIVIFLSNQQFFSTNFESEGKHIQSKINANINFCTLLQNNSLYIKTFQRGAGLTYSCGTGISSSVYVAMVKGIIKETPINVVTDGGEINIQITSTNEVIMKGPAQIICKGHYS